MHIATASERSFHPWVVMHERESIYSVLRLKPLYKTQIAFAAKDFEWFREKPVMFRRFFSKGLRSMFYYL
jgi:hypothetical protein